MQDETSTSEPKTSEIESNVDENSSETLTGNPRSRSVYDFLYHDARRVGSFLAQFESYGVPGAIKAGAAVGHTETDRKQISGALSLLLARGQGALDVGVTDEEKDSTEKTFDPFWNNAIKFLDYVSSAGLLQRDVYSALLGQIVLLRGTLLVLDPGIMKDSYSRPAIKEMMRDSFLASQPSLSGAQKKEQNKLFDVFIELLTRMPHTIQAQIVTDNYSAWAGLREDSLVTTSTDLMLKSGALVPGLWNMIGVMDSFPKAMLKHTPEGRPPDFDTMIREFTTAPIANLMTVVAPIIRNMLGRPENFYGVTPLLIFREVGPGTTEQIPAELTR